MITDLSYLESMSGNDLKFIREMVDIFRDQIREYSSDMPRLLEKGDYLTLSKVAHKAKSSVAVMGMTAEADLLKDLEIKAHDGIEPGSYPGMVDQFLEKSQLALKELEDYLSNPR